MAHFGTFWFAVSSWGLGLGNCLRHPWQRKSGHIVPHCTGKLCRIALENCAVQHCTWKEWHCHTLHCIAMLCNTLHCITICSTALLPCPHRLCSLSWTLDGATKPNLWSTLLKTIIWILSIIVFSSEYCPLISYPSIYIIIIGYHPPIYIILDGHLVILQTLGIYSLCLICVKVTKKIQKLAPALRK